MIIKNGYVYGEDKTFQKRDLYVEGGKIAADINRVSDRTELDAAGLYVIPGLIDVHSHGACGHDLCDADPAGLAEILRYQRAHGITSYCPTSMSLPKERLKEIFSTVPLTEIPDQAHIAGINMEGPFLDPAKKGAHAEESMILPDVDFFRECNAVCGGRIRLVTLAPGQKGDLEFIRALRDEVTISLGHSGAGYDAAKAALNAGASHITHLFNAMLPLGHREPGLIGAAVEAPACMAELICDGIHIHESAIRIAFTLFPDRIVLISDSMRAAGMENGTYELGGQQVTVTGRRAALADGTIAGSATNLYDCMLTAVAFGIPKEEAIAAATMNPAKSIGIYDQTGSLTPGKQSDILLTDSDLKLLRVI